MTQKLFQICENPVHTRHAGISTGDYWTKLLNLVYNPLAVADTMRCIGSEHGDCTDSRSGTGVKKCADGKFRCGKCRLESTSTSTAELIQSELLCFLATPWPDYSAAEIRGKCLNFYTEDEIAEAYHLLTDKYSDDTYDKITEDDIHN